MAKAALHYRFAITAIVLHNEQPIFLSGTLYFLVELSCTQKIF